MRRDSTKIRLTIKDFREELSLCRIRTGIRHAKKFIRLAIKYRGRAGTTPPQAIWKADGMAKPAFFAMLMETDLPINAFVTEKGSGCKQSNAYVMEQNIPDVSADIFERELCLSNDNKMTKEGQASGDCREIF